MRTQQSEFPANRGANPSGSAHPGDDCHLPLQIFFHTRSKRARQRLSEQFSIGTSYRWPKHYAGNRIMLGGVTFSFER